VLPSFTGQFRYRFARSVDLSERDKKAVLQTFDEAMKNGARTSTCYRLAAQVLQRRHHDWTYEYTAKQSTKTILDVRIGSLTGELLFGKK
jgi:hypothetical protein